MRASLFMILKRCASLKSGRHAVSYLSCLWLLTLFLLAYWYRAVEVTVRLRLAAMSFPSSSVFLAASVKEHEYAGIKMLYQQTCSSLRVDVHNTHRHRHRQACDSNANLQACQLPGIPASGLLFAVNARTCARAHARTHAHTHTNAA